MSSDCVESEPINSFALVTYIPDPLGRFFDDLRRRLVPGCIPHAHVTLLTPRPLDASAGVAMERIENLVKPLAAFDLQATDIAVFPASNVLYVELGWGRQQLLDLHACLNRDVLYFQEPYPYHPHITLAQELSAAEIPEAAEIARRTWAEYSGSRVFPVEQITFVQNTVANRWRDLGAAPLRQPVATW